VTGIPWIRVNYVDFLAQWWAIGLPVLVMVLILRRRGLLRPPRAPLLSWENHLYVLTRWPYIAWGVLAAGRQVIRPRKITFRVTPKGGGGPEPLRLRLVAPYLVTALVMAGAALYAQARTAAVGYAFLCVLGAVVYTVVALAVPLLHAREAAAAATLPVIPVVARTVAAPLAAALLVAVPTALAVLGVPGHLVAVAGPDWPVALLGDSQLLRLFDGGR
jgi:hypothetical protein